MADVIDRRDRNINTKYVDASGDGSNPEQVAAVGYSWDNTSLTWTKLLSDHTTGALKVSVVGETAIVSFATSQTLNVSNAGSVSVLQGTSPWLASIVGSINNNPLNVLASQAGSWTVGSGSNTLNVNVASLSASGTMNASIVGSAMLYQAPAKWSGTFKSAAASLGSFTQSSAGASTKNYLDGFTYSWTASFISSNATTFQIKDGGTVIYEEAIAGAGNAATVNGNKTVLFNAPLAGSAATAMTAQFSASSVGTVEIVDMWGYTGA